MESFGGPPIVSDGTLELGDHLARLSGDLLTIDETLGAGAWIAAALLATLALLSLANGAFGWRRRRQGRAHPPIAGSLALAAIALAVLGLVTHGRSVTLDRSSHELRSTQVTLFGAFSWADERIQIVPGSAECATSQKSKRPWKKGFGLKPREQTVTTYLVSLAVDEPAPSRARVVTLDQEPCRRLARLINDWL